MKSIFSYLLIIIAIICMLIGCGDESDNINTLDSQPVIDDFETISSATTIISHDNDVENNVNDESNENNENDENDDDANNITEQTMTVSNNETFDSPLPTVEAESETSSYETDTNVDDSQSLKVWIPSSGKKYHSNSGCSNMNSPRCVSVSEAVSLGYEPCKRCYN